MSPMNSDSDQPNPGRGRVVVGVDGSPPSMEALNWAATQARLSDAVLEIVHTRFVRKVASELIHGAEEEEASILNRAIAQAREMEPAIEVVGRIEDPPTAKSLIDASRGARLLVLGSRGLGGFKELALGSVSHQCANYAHCPVVIIRSGSTEN